MHERLGEITIVRYKQQSFAVFVEPAHREKAQPGVGAEEGEYGLALRVAGAADQTGGFVEHVGHTLCSNGYFLPVHSNPVVFRGNGCPEGCDGDIVDGYAALLDQLFGFTTRCQSCLSKEFLKSHSLGGVLHIWCSVWFLSHDHGYAEAYTGSAL
jgi:hypothetical protein